MVRQYDLVVIGTGTAARVTATRVRKAGWRVAVIDSRPFGGTCPLRGCDPKKMLVGGAEAVDHVRRIGNEVVAGDVNIDWPGLMNFKRSYTDPIPEAQERNYAEMGVDTCHGPARFTGPTTVAVGEEVLEGRYVLVAAGAEPVKLGIPGEEHLVTNEDFLSLKQLPRRIVLVGGGYIAAEFSHIAARAGAQVTVLQRADRMLPHFDPDLVGWLMDAFRRVGIDVHTRTTVQAIEATGSGLVIRATANGQPIGIEADLAVHAAGRVPALASLDLDAAGIAHDKGRLILNAFLQSASNPAVYAAGDAAQMGPPLTPVSGHDAGIVSANILQGNKHRPDYRGIPSVAFTIPPIAMVGLGEEDARAQGLKFQVNSRKASTWYTARQAAEPTYGFKVILEEGSDRILGAHLVGPHADDVVNLFALAIRHGLTADALKSTMFAYPTGASDIGSMLSG